MLSHPVGGNIVGHGNNNNGNGSSNSGKGSGNNGKGSGDIVAAITTAAASTTTTTTTSESLEARLRQLERERGMLQRDLQRCCATLRPDDGGAGHDLVIARLAELRTSDAAGLISLTRETYEIATKMSANIRRRDLERGRLSSVIQLLADVEQLDGSVRALERGDGELSRQCELLHTTTASARRIGEEAWACRHGQTEGSLTARLSAVRRTLLARLDDELARQRSTANIDERMGRAFEMLALFTLIDGGPAGLQSIARTVAEYAASSFRNIVLPTSTLDFRFAVKTGKVADFVHGLVGWCRTRLLQGPAVQNLEQAHACIVESIFLEAEAALSTVIRSFITERKVVAAGGAEEVTAAAGGAATPKDSATVDVRDLDLVLAETAMIIQNCVAVHREHAAILARAGSAGEGGEAAHNLDKLAALWRELIAAYLASEKTYLTLGIRMALRMNEVDTEKDKVSTCVEDVLFLAKKCCMRAVSVGDRAVLAEIIDCARIFISAEMVPAATRRLRQLFPDPKSGGDCVIIAANDGASARVLLERLTDDLRDVIEQARLYDIVDQLLPGIGPARPSSSGNAALGKIQTALDGLGALADTFETAIVRPGLEAVYSTRVKSKLAPFLVQLLAGSDGLGAVGDPPSLVRCVAHIEKNLLPLLDTLLDENAAQIIMMMSREITQQLERSLLATRWHWTPANLVVFERDLRRLVAFLAERTELQAKDPFVRALQMLAVLGGDLGESGSSAGGADGGASGGKGGAERLAAADPAWRLTEAEMSTLSALRQ